MMGGINDPLTLDLGISGKITVTDTLTFVIFTDRGGDRIERALLGDKYASRLISAENLITDFRCETGAG